MSLLFSDGLDLYSTLVEFEAAGWVVNQSFDVEVLTTGGRFGGGCVRVQNDENSPYIAQPVNISAATIYVQFSFKVEELSGATNQDWIAFYNNNGQDQVCRFRLQTNGAITVENAAGTVVGSTPAGVIKSGVWQYLETKVVSNGSSGEVKIEIDEEQVLSLTGLDTSITETDVDIVLFYSGSSVYNEGTVYDDVLILDNAGSYPHNTNMGDLRISTLLPNGDDTQADWTLSSGSNGYELIDDPVPGSNDGDGTYIYSNTDGHTSMFNFENMVGDPHQVLGVCVATQAKKDDAGTIRIRTVMESGTATDNGDYFSLSTGYTTERQIRERDPDGGGLFTKTKVDALKVGVMVEEFI